MPKAVPPPPPQPSLEETHKAVWHARGFAVLALSLFFGLAAMVQSDSFFVEFGRQNGASWNLKALDDLDVDAIRAHPGGQVIWLVGSSMLRDSFDVEQLNTRLSSSDSPYRAVKFGQTRGAAGISRGLLARLPLREGDVVLHGMSVINARKDWIERVGLPDWRVMMMLDNAQIWAIDEWSTQKKLEALVARPQTFFEYQEESMEGIERWLEGYVHDARAPDLPSGFRHLKYRHGGNKRRRATAVEAQLDESRLLPLEEFDLSATQFNHKGLIDMRAICAAAGVEIYIFEHTGRPSFQKTVVDPEVITLWKAWLAEQPDFVEFPQLKEKDFYDMLHPGRRGRAKLSAYLVRWLNTRE